MRIGRILIAWAVPASLVVCLLAGGCGFGPKTLARTRLPYNEVVKTTSEEQLLLNIVRLRYSDNASSLAVSSIAAQVELTRKLSLVPFFTSSAAGNAFGGYQGTVLPGAEFTGADRPTISYTPQDEVDFARRLFTPMSLDGITYLAQTTWPISTVFRLYLENLNWVPNAQNLSGPTPGSPPEFEEFLRGVAALRRLQTENKMAILSEERDERVGGKIHGSQISARDLIEAARANHEFKRDDEVDAGEQKDDKPMVVAKPDERTVLWSLTKKKTTPFLYVSPDAVSSPDWLEFCKVFKINPAEKKYEIEVTKLTPFPTAYPREGVKVIDLETRSLLQVLYFLSHGIDVPPEHVVKGLARVTLGGDGSVFDYDRVLGGLFKVRSIKGKSRPANAAVAVHYLDHWYYLDETDHHSRATFALLFQLARLELGTKAGGAAPVLTLPVGGR